ncbi:hypothetical protein C8Q76DRAFT_709113 [Earliella scabrosa]|nr:hypothetical protein C8Q76DRAFT_709113 [Earliella scabrosa]
MIKPYPASLQLFFRDPDAHHRALRRALYHTPHWHQHSSYSSTREAPDARRTTLVGLTGDTTPASP